MEKNISMPLLQHCNWKRNSKQFWSVWERKRDTDDDDTLNIIEDKKQVMIVCIEVVIKLSLASLPLAASFFKS